MTQKNDMPQAGGSAWQPPVLRRLGTIRDIAFRGGRAQQGASQTGSNLRSSS